MFSTKSNDTNKILKKLNRSIDNIWKRRVSYVFIQDKTYYVNTSDIPNNIHDGESNAHCTYRRKKWEEDNTIVKATILSYMQDELILLFEDHMTAREMIEALAAKYNAKFETHCFKNLIECT